MEEKKAEVRKIQNIKADVTLGSALSMSQFKICPTHPKFPSPPGVHPQEQHYFACTHLYSIYLECFKTHLSP